MITYSGRFIVASAFGLGFCGHDRRPSLEDRDLADLHRDVIRIETRARATGGREDPPPVGIAAMKRSLDELRARDRPSDLDRVRVGPGAVDLDPDQVLRPLSVRDDLLRERFEHLGERSDEASPGRALLVDRATGGCARGERIDRVVGAGVAVDRRAIEGDLGGLPRASTKVVRSSDASVVTNARVVAMFG